MNEPAKPDYSAFNKFQTYFYTNIIEFNKFTNFEIKQHAFMLLQNLTKGFPTLATDIMNVYAPDFITFDNSPELIRALQRKFVNDFSRPRVPQHVYYKSAPAKKGKKEKAIKIDKNLLIFSDDIVFQIKSILFYDSKSYEYYKFSEKVQSLGKTLVAEFDKKELILMKKIQEKASKINL